MGFRYGFNASDFRNTKGAVPGSEFKGYSVLIFLALLRLPDA